MLHIKKRIKSRKESAMMELKGKAKPKAVESFLNDKRLLNDFLEVVERKIVEDKIEEAKQKFCFNFFHSNVSFQKIKQPLFYHPILYIKSCFHMLSI